MFGKIAEVVKGNWKSILVKTGFIAVGIAGLVLIPKMMAASEEIVEGVVDNEVEVQPAFEEPTVGE